MIVKEQHFDVSKTDESLVIWVSMQKASLGEELSTLDYVKWYNHQSKLFKREIGINENMPIAAIHDGHARFRQYLRGLLDAPIGQLTIFNTEVYSESLMQLN